LGKRGKGKGDDRGHQIEISGFSDRPNGPMQTTTLIFNISEGKRKKEGKEVKRKTYHLIFASLGPGLATVGLRYTADRWTSGIARNFNLFSSLSLFSPICPLFPSPFTPFPCPLLFPSSPVLEVGPLKIQLGDLRELCELPSQNQIWCILALKMRSGGNDFNYFKLYFYFKYFISSI